MKKLTVILYVCMLLAFGASTAIAQSIESRCAGGNCGGSDHRTTSVPEPASLILLGLGVMGVAGIGRKMKKKN